MRFGYVGPGLSNERRLGWSLALPELERDVSVVGRSGGLDMQRVPIGQLMRVTQSIGSFPLIACPHNRCEIAADQHLWALVTFRRGKEAIAPEVLKFNAAATDAESLAFGRRGCDADQVRRSSGRSFLRLSVLTLSDQRRWPWECQAEGSADMGLPGQIYEFPDSAPSFEEIFQTVEGKEKGRFSMEVICRKEAPPLQLTTEDRAYIKELLAKRAKRQSKKTKGQRSIPFAPESMRLSKGRENLSIHRSRDGQKIFVFGQYGPDLFKSACNAIERLGGSPSN